MVERLLEEIKTCLKNRCYLSALTLTVSLPDICGKAEYPKQKTGERYKNWYQNFVYSEDSFGLRMPKEVLYSLRCNLLHEGNPAIDKKCKVGKFALMIRENSASVPIESSRVRIENDGTKVYEIYNVNLIFLCNKMMSAVLNYYTKNKEKFNFFNYRITSTTDDVCETFNIVNENIF